MSGLVIDASIAIKWVVDEAGTNEALSLRQSAKFLAPDLLIAECANILWKKVRRGELSIDHAVLGARLLQASDIELVPTRPLLEKALRIALELNHPAYDCLYIALAVENQTQFVTADWRLLQRLSASKVALRSTVISLGNASGPQ